MKHNFTFLLISLFVLVSVNNLSAAHIVGGETTYRFLGHNADTTLVNFEVNFTLFRTSIAGGAEFDNASEVQFGIYGQDASGSWTLYDVVRNISPTNIKPLQNTNFFCLTNDPTTEIMQEKGHYVFQVELEISDQNYMISYQRCCRTPTISNIDNSGETGFALDVIITPEAQKRGNSSPTFKTDPPLFICSQVPIDLQLSATDVDGDDLRYKFCAPKTAGGTTDATSSSFAGCCDCVRPDPDRCAPPFDLLFFNPPYTVDQPLGSDLTYSSIEGQLQGLTQVNGQYAVGLCVEEFRNGRKIGEVRRDYTFAVVSCEVDSSALSQFYLDADGDGYGDADVSVMDCDVPEGYVSNDLDCNDDDPAINPDSDDEAGDGIDMNCDGVDWVLSNTQEAPTDKLTLYPNPSSTTLHLSGSQNYDFEILDLNGITRLSGKTNGKPIVIQELDSGVYYVRVGGLMRTFVKL